MSNRCKCYKLKQIYYILLFLKRGKMGRGVKKVKEKRKQRVAACSIAIAKDCVSMDHTARCVSRLKK